PKTPSDLRVIADRDGGVTAGRPVRTMRPGPNLGDLPGRRFGRSRDEHVDRHPNVVWLAPAERPAGLGRHGHTVGSIALGEPGNGGRTGGRGLGQDTPSPVRE